MTYQDTIYDNNGAITAAWTHTPGTADFIANEAGTFNIIYRANVTASAGGVFLMRAVLNGSTIAGSDAIVQLPRASPNTINTPGIYVIATSLIVTCAIGDILKIQFTSNDGSGGLVIAPVVGTDPVSTSITIVRIN